MPKFKSQLYYPSCIHSLGFKLPVTQFLYLQNGTDTSAFPIQFFWEIMFSKYHLLLLMAPIWSPPENQDSHSSLSVNDSSVFPRVWTPHFSSYSINYMYLLFLLPFNRPHCRPLWGVITSASERACSFNFQEGWTGKSSMIREIYYWIIEPETIWTVLCL